MSYPTGSGVGEKKHYSTWSFYVFKYARDTKKMMKNKRTRATMCPNYSVRSKYFCVLPKLNLRSKINRLAAWTRDLWFIHPDIFLQRKLVAIVSPDIAPISSIHVFFAWNGSFFVFVISAQSTSWDGISVQGGAPNAKKRKRAWSPSPSDSFVSTTWLKYPLPIAGWLLSKIYLSHQIKK